MRPNTLPRNGSPYSKALIQMSCTPVSESVKPFFGRFVPPARHGLRSSNRIFCIVPAARLKLAVSTTGETPLAAPQPRQMNCLGHPMGVLFVTEHMRVARRGGLRSNKRLVSKVLGGMAGVDPPAGGRSKTVRVRGTPINPLVRSSHNASHFKPERDDVAVLDFVVLAFEAEVAGGLCVLD